MHNMYNRNYLHGQKSDNKLANSQSQEWWNIDLKKEKIIIENTTLINKWK